MSIIHAIAVLPVGDGEMPQGIHTVRVSLQYVAENFDCFCGLARTLQLRSFYDSRTFRILVEIVFERLICFMTASI